jgi:hypothetical protein
MNMCDVTCYKRQARQIAPDCTSITPLTLPVHIASRHQEKAIKSLRSDVINKS